MSQPVDGDPPGDFPRAEAILATYLRDNGEGPDVERIARDLLRRVPEKEKPTSLNIEIYLTVSL